MKIVARGCKYVRGKEGEQFFRRRIEAIRRGRIVKHDEATDGLTTSQQIAHESFGIASGEGCPEVIAPRRAAPLRPCRPTLPEGRVTTDEITQQANGAT